MTAPLRLIATRLLVPIISCVTTLSVAFEARASDTSCLVLELRQLRQSSGSGEQAYARLRSGLADRASFISAKNIYPDFIQTVEGDLRGGQGGTAWGVVKVHTENGPMALKIIDQPMLESMSISSSYAGLKVIDEAIVQDSVAQSGWALPVYGLIQKEALDALFSRFPKLYDSRRQDIGNPTREPQWAFLMPVLRNAYTPRVTQTSIKVQDLPAHAKDWNWTIIENWYQNAWRSLDQRGLKATDLQVIISEQGEPFLFDLGLALVFDVDGTKGKPYWVDDPNMSANRGEFLNQWNLIKQKAIAAGYAQNSGEKP